MDPYSVLGVSRSADGDAIKKAYRQLAKEYHPDRHPGDTRAAERFKEISAAYKILGDQSARRRFDRGEIDAWGSEKYRSATSRGAAHAYSRTSSWRNGDGGVDREELFAELFGRRRGARRQEDSRGLDHTYALSLDFVEAAKGCTKRLTLKNGRTIDVKVPPGVRPGQQIRLKGQGQAGTRVSQPGDALVEMDVAEHPYFMRNDRDVYLDVPVTLQEAILGAKITVPTLWGEVSVTVPKGANTGTVLRLKNKGIPDEDGDYGHQFLTLHVLLPTKVDSKLESFIEEWAPGRDYDVRKHLK